MPRTPDSELKLAFDASLIPQQVKDALPSDLHIRPLASTDYARGHLSVLSALTTVPDPGAEAWLERFEQLANASPKTYFPLVIVDAQSDVILATGTVFLEFKFIRNLGAAGHIEDIAVDPKTQGKGLGKRIIAALTGVSEAVGAYKTILDCSDDNQPFYEKCGYKLAGVEMAKYAAGAKPAHTPTS